MLALFWCPSLLLKIHNLTTTDFGCNVKYFYCLSTQEEKSRPFRMLLDILGYTYDEGTHEGGSKYKDKIVRISLLLWSESIGNDDDTCT